MTYDQAVNLIGLITIGTLFLILFISIGMLFREVANLFHYIQDEQLQEELWMELFKKYLDEEDDFYRSHHKISIRIK